MSKGPDLSQEGIYEPSKKAEALLCPANFGCGTAGIQQWTRFSDPRAEPLGQGGVWKIWSVSQSCEPLNVWQACAPKSNMCLKASM